MIISGINPVAEALKGPGVERVLVARGRRLPPELRELLSSAGLKPEIVPRQRLDKLAGTDKHQGVIAVIPPVRYAEPKQFLDAILGARGVGLVLHDLLDPGNIGALVRSALFLGVKGVLLSGHHTPGITEAGVRSSQGAALRLPVSRTGNPKSLFKYFQERGGWVVGLAPAGQDIRTADMPKPLLVVLGNEGRGLPQKLLERCDTVVSVPGPGELDSLNVAAAGAIGMWEAMRR